MGPVNRDAHARDRGAELRQMHDAPALVLHFHFFLGVAAGQKGIDVRENVERDRMGIDFGHRRLFFGGRFDLGPQFADRARTAPGNGLITGGKNTPDAKRPVQRIERHERDRGGAIWIRDQSGMLPNVFAIYFRNHQRDIGFHPEHGGIIDHNRAGRARDRCVTPRDVAAGAEEREIDALKRRGESSSAAISLFRNETTFPAERLEDSGSSRSTGNPRRSRTPSSSAPTAPVAPTTAM